MIIIGFGDSKVVGILLAFFMELEMTRRFFSLVSFSDTLICTNGYSVRK